MLQGSVQLPVVGPTSKRALAIGGTAAVALMAVLWWRRRSAAAAPPAAAAVDDTSTVDSATGGGAGGGSAGGGGGAGDAPANLNPTSNPQWTALVMQDLSGVVDPGELATAIGLYLTGSAVTPAQTLIIDQAIAVAGYPPVSGPSGYPPAIRTQPSTGQTPPPPAPGPSPGPGPKAPATPGGVHVVSVTRTSGTLAWSAATGATGYRVYGNDGALRTAVTGTSATIGGLAPGAGYGYRVSAFNSAGESARSGVVYISTSR